VSAVVLGVATVAATLALVPHRVVRPVVPPATTLPPVHIPWRSVAIVFAIAAGVAVAPLIPLVAAAAWWARRRTRARHSRLAEARAIRRALPDTVDLLVLATTAGLSLPVAHPLVAAHAPAPVGEALAAAHRAAEHGRPRADALVDALAPLGERAHALAHVLGDHLRYGVPLLPGLERTGLELALDRRRAAEQDARRVPVRLLAPLVSCVLPAFAVLTVVPLLAASLRALPL
jgi:Flp pilus assembly protein TadB